MDTWEVAFIVGGVGNIIDPPKIFITQLAVSLEEAIQEAWQQIKQITAPELSVVIIYAKLNNGGR